MFKSHAASGFNLKQAEEKVRTGSPILMLIAFTAIVLLLTEQAYGQTTWPPTQTGTVSKGIAELDIPTSFMTPHDEIFRLQSPFALLYDQTNNSGTVGQLSQNFATSNDSADSRIADDFAVPAGQVWTVQQVNVLGGYDFGVSTATTVNITFYSNASALPGAAVAGCVYSNVPITSGASTGDFNVALPTNCVLGSGTYWFSVQANLDGAGWYWTERNIATGAGAAWHNPGGFYNQPACTPSFGRKTTCIPNSAPDNLFQIIGTSAGTGVPVNGLFGVQPSTGRIVRIDPTTGAILSSFLAPSGLAAGHTLIGLSMAENDSTLLYINHNVSTTLSRINPANGSVLSTVFGDEFPTDGLSFDSNAGTTYLFYSHSSSDLHRQTGFGGSTAFNWETGVPVGGLGGDGHGRQFGYFSDGLIHEYSAVTSDGIFNGTIPSPTNNVQGMAFDGTNLYVSNSSGSLFTVNPNNGVVTRSVAVSGGPIYGLAASANVTTTSVVTVSFESNPSSIQENAPNGQFLVYTFRRTGSLGSQLDISVSVSGNAQHNVDYSVASGFQSFNGATGVVRFNAGSDIAQVRLDPIDDSTVGEGQETISLFVANGPGYTAGNPNSATGMIIDDDVNAVVSIAVTPQSVSEDGLANLVYTFTRTGPTTNQLFVSFAKTGTADFNFDYDCVAGTGAAGLSCSSTIGQITFAVNAQTAQLIIDPKADIEPEQDEFIVHTLTQGSGYTIGSPSSASGTISNDDTGVSVTVAPQSVPENGLANLVYTFARSSLIGGAITVGYTIGGTATGTDYDCSPGTGATAASCAGTSGSVTFAPGTLNAQVIVDPRPDLLVEDPETVVLIVIGATGYTPGSPAVATGIITNVNAATCAPVSIAVGQSFNGILDADACLLNGQRTDFYTFTGAVNQRIALTMTTSGFSSRLELVDPLGAVIPSTAGVRDSRLPDTGYRTLTMAGTYMVRAIATQSGGGSYLLSLFEPPVQNCIYTLSPTSTDAPSTGGSAPGGAFFFDVLTQPGCAPEAAPVVPAGSIYNIVSYVNGRVRFNVDPQPVGGGARTAPIAVAGRTHTINQFARVAPNNDRFADAQIVMLPTQPNPTPTPITGSNTDAGRENGEPSHSGNTPAKSIWYSFAPTVGGLYSFSTSGSSFDTVMAIYACPPSGGCTFANFTLVGSNDDVTSFDKTSKVNFRADAGVRYVIAVDGKNGAVGTVQLSVLQYERLFRLYLQNQNGNPVTLVPDRVLATNGPITRDARRISVGVYEFDLPVSTSPFKVTIEGPEGIAWEPNNFFLDTSFRLLDELMQGSPAGRETMMSYPQCTNTLTGCKLIGYVKNVSERDVTERRFQVKISYSVGATTAGQPADQCRILDYPIRDNVSHAEYECRTFPQANHEVVPSQEMKRFEAAIYTLTTPAPTIQYVETSIATPFFTALESQTFSISGRVLDGREGTRVDLAYTAPGGMLISDDTRTGPNGAYEFRNLQPNTPDNISYQPRATRGGANYNLPPPVVLTNGNASNINITTAAPCESRAVDQVEIGAGAINSFVDGSFVVTTLPTTNCEWTATSSDTSWLTLPIFSGGNGQFLAYRATANTGAARMASITISGRPTPVVVRQAAGLSPMPTITNINPAAVTAGGPGFNLTINGTNFISASRVTLNNGPERTPVVFGSTQMVVAITAADIVSGGTIAIRVRNPEPGGGESPPVNLTVGCNYTLSPPIPASFPAAGGTGTFMVSTTPGCTWSPIASDYCMMTGLTASGQGTGSVNFTVSQNRRVERSTTIRIGGESITITQAAATGQHRTRFDFDGDGRAELAVFRPSNGNWFTQPLNSSGAVFRGGFGMAGDTPVAADYDGDGKTDLAVFRPSTLSWHILNSSNMTMVSMPFGQSGDVPVPADYDGDGRSDIAIYRRSGGIWGILRSSDGAIFVVQHGNATDRPVPADYDGDRRADVAVFRPSNGVWYVIGTSRDIPSLGFGSAEDLPVPADYNGDGEAELAVFRPSDGTWYRLDPDTPPFAATPWGRRDDIPVPADYNGDGATDLAVYRPSTGVWFIWSCRNNPQHSAQGFGTSGDILIPFTGLP